MAMPRPIPREAPVSRAVFPVRVTAFAPFRGGRPPVAHGWVRICWCDAGEARGSSVMGSTVAPFGRFLGLRLGGRTAGASEGLLVGDLSALHAV